MRFAINFGAGTFHQHGCTYARDIPTLEVDYDEVVGLLAAPLSYTKACSRCLPLLDHQARTLSAALRGTMYGIPVAKWDKAKAVQESYVKTDDEVDATLELALLRMREDLKR